MTGPPSELAAPVTGQLSEQVAGSIPVVGEHDDLLALEIARQEALQLVELGVPIRRDAFDEAPYAGKRLHIMLERLMNPPEVVLRGIERRQGIH